MDKTMRTRLLAELKTMRHGQAIREYLEEELKELDSVLNCDTLEDLKSRQAAVKVIKRLFSFIDTKPSSSLPRSSFE